MYVYAHVYTYVNSSDMNDYELPQIRYLLLDSIYPKWRPVDRWGKILFQPCFLPQLYPNRWFCFPDVSLSTVGVLWVSLPSFITDVERDQCSHIFKPRLQTIYVSFARNKQNLIVFPIVRDCSLIHTW